MKKIGIYCIKNTVNNKVYIGSSKNIQQRFRQHKHQLLHNIHGNKHLNSSANNYGIDNFIFYILEECGIDSLIDKESFYITLYNSLNPNYGYNKATNISNTSGYKWSEESKKRFSEKCKGRKLSEEHKRNIGFSSKNRIYKKGYKHTNKAKNNISLKHSKKVLQFTLDNQFVKEWRSIKEIGVYLGKTTSSISACCRGIRKQSLGYIWKFKI